MRQRNLCSVLAAVTRTLRYIQSGTVCNLRFILLGTALGANAWAAPATASDFSLPVRAAKGCFMVAPVSINGRGPFDFLVDTGTTTTLVDPKLAEELNLKQSGQISITSLDHSVPFPRYFLQSLQAGSASVSHLEAVGMPMPQLRALGSKVRGILGMNFLLQFSFLLDYEHHLLEIFPFPERARAPDGVRVHAEINDLRVFIPVTSEAAARGTWRLMLDSGISQLLVFEQGIAPEGKGIDSCRRASCPMQVVTILSSQEAGTARVRDLTIADAHLRDVPAVIMHNELIDSAELADGLLPASIFRSVFFDRTSATVVFGPKAATHR